MKPWNQNTFSLLHLGHSNNDNNFQYTFTYQNFLLNPIIGVLVVIKNIY
jgi:hypothetical protein